MVLIAMRMVLYNTVHFLLTNLGMGVLFFLSATTVGLLVGWCHTTSAIIHHAGADVWVMAERTPTFESGVPISDHRLREVQNVPGVDRVEGLYVGWKFWRGPDGRQINIGLVGVDSRGVGGPWNMASGTTDVVERPNAVIVDALYLDAFGVSGVGDEGQVMSRPVVVRGICRGVRAFTNNPWVFSSLRSAQNADSLYRNDEITYVLAWADEGLTPRQLASTIEQQVPHVEALTGEQFEMRTMKYWMLTTGAGISVVVAAGLGLLVGSIVSGQTLFAITQDHLKEYAVLFALGFRREQMMAIVALQALLIGAGGVVLGTLAFAVETRISARTLVPIETTLIIHAALIVVFLACSLFASLLSVRSLFRIDPVTVFEA